MKSLKVALNPNVFRILLVEDEPLWQEGIRALLSSMAGWDLAAVADNYEDALAAFEKIEPHIVLLDWQIKGRRDGLAVGDTLVEFGFPTERIILVSGAEKSLIPNHPYGYVPKPLIARQLIETIERVMKT